MFKLEFTLDNHVYSIAPEEDISIVLPRSSICINDLNTPNIIPYNITNIEIILYLRYFDNVYNVSIDKSCDDQEILRTTNINILPNSTTCITFVTNTGGKRWLIKSDTYSTDYVPPIITGVQTVNNKTGPDIILYADDIQITKDGPTIKEYIENIDKNIEETTSTKVKEILPSLLESELSNIDFNTKIEHI